MKRLAWGVSAIVFTPHLLGAWHQSPAAARFDVASVRLNTGEQQRAAYVTSPGLITATNYPVKMLILQAYGIANAIGYQFKLQGGPERVLAARVDVRATFPAGTPVAQTAAMLQALLAERFKLRVHTESRPTPVYALKQIRDGRLGPELRHSKIDCSAVLETLRAEGKRPGDGVPSPLDAKGRPVCWDLGATPSRGVRLTGAGPLSHLIVAQTQAFIDRPVFDQTGLTGNFEWHLQWALDEFGVFAAFEQQLGLKLEPTTAPFEVIVIDSLELPTPN